MGPVVTIVVLIYQQATGKPFTWGWFAAVICAGLAWHFRSELVSERVKALPLGYPKIYLRYEQSFDTDFNSSGFFLQVEGEKKAFDVRVSSEPVVAQGHKRITMQWEVPKKPISTTSVPIHASCMLCKPDGLDYPAGGISSGQIHRFFKEKKGFTNELEVTVTYKDVDGRACPPKKFKITSNRDYRGNFEIGCIPIEN
jgi:hypothetical protein